MSLNNLKYVLILILSFTVAARAGVQKTPEPVSEATQKADTKNASAADKSQLVKVNKVERADEISVLVYVGGQRQPTLNDLIDFDKLRAIRLTGKPVDVYLGSIASDVKGTWFEHYFGTLREKGVVSDIACVRWSNIASRLITEGKDKGMLCVWHGVYPPDEKPKELHDGVLSRKGV